MGEIRRLQPAGTTAAATVPKWGGPQRFLLAGVVLLVIAGVAAAVFYGLSYSAHQRMSAYIEQQREIARHRKAWESLQYFRYQLAPGIDALDFANYRRYLETLAIGKVLAGIAAAAGAVLAGIGIAGMRGRGAKGVRNHAKSTTYTKENRRQE